ncbi:GAF domain-containing protein [Mycoplasmopsis columboralis]|uniref:Free methionine-R-sulfoxide reductase n=3 Tax=Mycoplasmopsis columboralis TaxID=171282 RepID=A0A449B6P0_9BACT|nr:GAF domain-containing protein [Mycoplasmopsis columboralis]VEU76277.1 Free methionine-R-sulfoxide reductase [Mycoplasmopsis columboralis]
MNEYKNLIDNEKKIYTILANTSAFIWEKFDNLNWAGFYVNEDNTLYLHAFQGKVACSVIPFNRGVCGHAATIQKTVVVDDVNTFKDHIVCDSNSKSEVVIPVIVKNKLFAVLDIDAPVYKRFDTQTVKSLEEIVSILEHELEKLL